MGLEGSKLLDFILCMWRSRSDGLGSGMEDKGWFTCMMQAEAYKQKKTIFQLGQCACACLVQVLTDSTFFCVPVPVPACARACACACP